MAPELENHGKTGYQFILWKTMDQESRPGVSKTGGEYQILVLAFGLARR
jgi:hypothetical protein